MNETYNSIRELMRSSGLKNGALSHYIGKLEKNGIIKVVRGPMDKQDSILTKNYRRRIVVIGCL